MIEKVVSKSPLHLWSWPVHWHDTGALVLTWVDTIWSPQRPADTPCGHWLTVIRPDRFINFVTSDWSIVANPWLWLVKNGLCMWSPDCHSWPPIILAGNFGNFTGPVLDLCTRCSFGSFPTTEISHCSLGELNEDYHGWLLVSFSC